MFESVSAATASDLISFLNAISDARVRLASLRTQLWQWVGRSVTLFGVLPPNRTQTMTLSHSGASELGQLMDGTTAGALIPEIVRRGFQDLLKAEVSAATAATRHERCPDECTTHRNGYRQRLLTTQVGDLSLAIRKLRQASFFPDWLEPRRRLDKALYAVVMEAYTGGISTRKVDGPVEALGGPMVRRQTARSAP